MSEQKKDPPERGGTHWYLPIFELHPSAAVLLLFFSMLAWLHWPAKSHYGFQRGICPARARTWVDWFSPRRWSTSGRSGARRANDKIGGLIAVLYEARRVAF